MQLLAKVSRLALKDWRHDGMLTACSVLALVSILVPLMILLGLRNGVVTTLKDRLMENPALLAVSPTGSGSGYTEAWLDTLRGRPDVAFVIPKTREISASVLMRNPAGQSRQFLPMDIEPTAKGDPLLTRFQAVPGSKSEITLSHVASERLKAVPGSEILMQLGRTVGNGRPESLTVPLRVKSILPLEAESKALAFVQLSLLETIENYRDGYAVAEWKAAGPDVPRQERRFARFRLYARHMDDVAVLRDEFARQGIEVHTSAFEIQSFQEINSALTILFILIAGTVSAGFAASTASSVLAGVRRKDKHLGMLRLIGFPGKAIMAFPLVQALLTALCGCMAASIAYACISFGLNALFSEKFGGAAVTLLPLNHSVLLVLGVCVISLCAGLPGAARAARIEPSDVLREI